MEFIGTLLMLAGTAVLGAGVVAFFRPIARLHIANRKQAAAATVLGLLMGTLGSSIAPTDVSGSEAQYMAIGGFSSTSPAVGLTTTTTLFATITTERVTTTTSPPTTTTVPATTTTQRATTTTAPIATTSIELKEERRPKSTTTTAPPRTTTTPPTPAPTTTEAKSQVPAGCKHPCVSKTVHPGAFCSEHGWYGLTKKGVLMECTDAPDDDRYRWRKA